MAVLPLPESLLYRAKSPMAVFVPPVWLLKSAWNPSAVLLLTLS